MKDDQADLEKEKVMATHLELTARTVGGKIVIESNGKGSAELPKGSGPSRFTFRLINRTNFSVEFAQSNWLWVDESEDCPPKEGIHTDQIEHMVRTDMTAAFTDKNCGPERTLSYALLFECDDPDQEPPMFDPIIINGGSV